MASWRDFDNSLIDTVKTKPVSYNTRLREFRNNKSKKTFSPIPFSRITATVATEWNYGNGTTERQNGNGNRMVETRHKYAVFLDDNSEMPRCHSAMTGRSTTGPESTWETLSTTHRDSPFFTVDTDLLSAPATYDNMITHSTTT